MLRSFVLLGLVAGVVGLECLAVPPPGVPSTLFGYGTSAGGSLSINMDGIVDRGQMRCVTAVRSLPSSVWELSVATIPISGQNGTNPSPATGCIRVEWISPAARVRFSWLGGGGYSSGQPSLFALNVGPGPCPTGTVVRNEVASLISPTTVFTLDSTNWVATPVDAGTPPGVVIGIIFICFVSVLALGAILLILKLTACRSYWEENGNKVDPGVAQA